MIIREALQQAEQLYYSDSARLDAEVLLADALDKDRTFLYAWPERELSEHEQLLFLQHMQRRSTGEPVAHIIKRREFWSLTLEVNASTLIPRPDTELLVEQALAVVAQEGLVQPRILDLGTGTGAVALALASELPNARVMGVDSSAEAVALTQRNAQRLKLPIQVVQSNWFARVQRPFELIVANPPYIDAADPHLHQGDVRFEPRSALVADNAGLADLMHIINTAPRYLSHGGWLLLEHGWQQGDAVRQLLAETGFSGIFTAQDYSGNDRISGGQRHD